MGNYAYTGKNSIEGDFIHSQLIKHYGAVHYVGSKDAASDLRNAGNLFGGGTIEDKKEALSDLLGDAETYHVLTTYADDLHHPLAKPPLGASSLNNDAANKYLSNLFGNHFT